MTGAKRKCRSCGGELEHIETVTKGDTPVKKLVPGYSEDETRAPGRAYRLFECSDCGAEFKR